jgi:murein L,D-transpeptidase YafK
MMKAALTLVLLAAAILARAGEIQADEIVVRKGKRELTLLRDGNALKTYRIALGRNPAGAKEREGDGKTPEGDYVISGRNPRSAFHLSLRISYPSDADRDRARRQGVDPVGDIMIHGRPNSGPARVAEDWTEGCIAVTNEEIEEIWRLVPDGSRVRILP